MWIIIAIIAAILGANDYFWDVELDRSTLLTISLTFSALLIILPIYLLGSILTPLQKGEQNTTPRVVELFYDDTTLKWALVLLFTWPLFLIAISFAPLREALPILIFFIGLGFSLFVFFARRLQDYINPFKVIHLLGKQAQHAIDFDKDAKLIEIIEAVAEIAIKAIVRGNSALGNNAVTELEKMGKSFLGGVKSIAHQTQDAELSAQGVPDTITFVLLFLLQHMEAVFAKALEKRSELAVGHVITAYAKLAAYAVTVDASLLQLPLHFLRRATLKAMKHEMPDAGVKATMGLLELAKNLPKIKNIEYQELTVPGIALITTLEEIAKETFKQDKQTKIQVLMMPFVELMNTFDREPLRNHPDIPYLAQQVNRVIAEFKALEEVLKTMPPLPDITSEPSNP